MEQHNRNPPAWLVKFLLSFLREDLREEVCGDLNEKYRLESIKKPLWRANLHYAYQVIHYIRPFAMKSFVNTAFSSLPVYASYFKVGWRNLFRSKGYSFINIGGLSLAMCVAMAIGLWIQDELAYNRYFDNYEIIAKVYRSEKWDGVRSANTSQVTGLGTLLKSEYSAAFKQVVMVRGRVENRVIASNEKKLTQPGYFMQAEGGEMFTLRMKYGTRDGLKDLKSVLLSESLARRLFGDIDPTNLTVSMDANWELRVAGVYEDLPRNTELYEATWFAPLDLYLNGWSTLNMWDNYNMNIWVQLNPGYEIDRVSGTIKHAMINHVRAEVAAVEPQLFLHPMSRLHLYGEFTNGIETTSNSLRFVWFYGIICVFVLMLACINFTNLSTARTEKRSREIGIRKSIGSQKHQLIHQFLSESVVTVTISFASALALLWLTIPWFNDIADKKLAIPWQSITFWMTAMCFIVATSVLAGGYPAFYLSSVNPIKALKGTFKGARRAATPRRVLVLLQFVVSICLAIGTWIVYQQIKFVKDRPVGYSRDRLVELRPTSPEYQGKHELIRNEMLRTGAVEEVAAADYSVTSNLGSNSGFQWPGYNPAQDPSFNTVRVTHEYGKTVGLEFLSGRDFSRQHVDDRHAILINESARQLMRIIDPVGTTIPWRPDGRDQGTFTVIGVFRDMVKESPYAPTDPSIVFLSEHTPEWLYVRIRPDVSASEALDRIQPVFSKLVPSAPFDYKFVSDTYDAKFRGEERIVKLAAVSSILAVTISCLGLFGLASYMTEQRTKEISIRKVLGASVVQLCKLIATEFVVLVGLASCIALPIVHLFMENWLTQYKYRFHPGPGSTLWIIVAAFGIAVTTVSFQALRSALRNPAESLKNE